MTMYNPPHPGEIVKLTLIEGCNLTVTEAAKLLDISRPALSKLINGQADLSPEMAIRLSIALNTSSEMWFNLKSAHDRWAAEKKRKTLLNKVTSIKGTNHTNPKVSLRASACRKSPQAKKVAKK